MRDTQTETCHETKLFDRLIGSTNESSIYIEGLEIKALVDTGSMVSTISENFYNNLNPKPELHTLRDMQLNVEAANGQLLPYLGYIEAKVSLPFMDVEPMYIPLLVIPMNAYNEVVPALVGTNIIRQYKLQMNDDVDNNIPKEWNLAVDAISNRAIGFVRTTSQVTLRPMETRTVTGLVRKTHQVESGLD